MKTEVKCVSSYLTSILKRFTTDPTVGVRILGETSPNSRRKVNGCPALVVHTAGPRLVLMLIILYLAWHCSCSIRTHSFSFTLQFISQLPLILSISISHGEFFWTNRNSPEFNRNSIKIVPEFVNSGRNIRLYFLLKFRITGIQFTGIHRNSPEFTNSCLSDKIHRDLSMLCRS